MDILIFWYVDSLSKLFRNRLVQLSGFFYPNPNFSIFLSQTSINRFQRILSRAQIFFGQTIQRLIHGIDHLMQIFAVFIYVQ